MANTNLSPQFDKDHPSPALATNITTNIFRFRSFQAFQKIQNNLNFLIYIYIYIYRYLKFCSFTFSYTLYIYIYIYIYIYYILLRADKLLSDITPPPPPPYAERPVTEHQQITSNSILH